jgi:hypothetical protein
LPARQELVVEGGDAPGVGVAGGLFFAKHCCQFAELQSQVGDGGLAIAQSRVELAFAQVQDVGADFEGLLLVGSGALCGLEFELGAATAFVEGLHPEGFGDVGDGFGEAVERGRA